MRYDIIDDYSEADMRPFLTPHQNIALSLVFQVMGEKQANRSTSDYMTIAARLPPMKKLLDRVNALLQELHETEGSRLHEICRFKAGDKRIVFEPFPKTISYETLRLALVNSGMRPARERSQVSA